MYTTITELDKFKSLDQLFISRRRRERREHRQKLLTELRKAMSLGNLYGEPALIQFNDQKGISKSIEEIVQTVTERYIVFRGGLTIPIKRVLQVTL